MRHPFWYYDLVVSGIACTKLALLLISRRVLTGVGPTSTSGGLEASLSISLSRLLRDFLSAAASQFKVCVCDHRRNLPRAFEADRILTKANAHSKENNTIIDLSRAGL